MSKTAAPTASPQPGTLSKTGTTTGGNITIGHYILGKHP